MNNLDVCLNITEDCDLNCFWCYQQEKRAKQHLSIHKLSFLREVFDSLDITSVTLIGGEPTIHPQFNFILQHLSKYNITLATNGLSFLDSTFLESCLQNKIGSIVLSFKGVDEQGFQSCTRVDRFYEFLQALENLQKISLPISFNFICTEDFLQPHMIQKAFHLIQKVDLPFVVLSDLRPYFIIDQIYSSYKTIPAFESFCTECLRRGIEIIVRPNNPLCWYSKSFITTLLTQHRLHVQCAVRNGGRLHFSPNLDLILCNTFHNTILGQWGKNYSSSQQFIEYIKTLRESKMLSKLSLPPSEACAKCSLWRICGGSCIIHWINKGGIEQCSPWKN